MADDDEPKQAEQARERAAYRQRRAVKPPESAFAPGGRKDTESAGLAGPLARLLIPQDLSDIGMQLALTPVGGALARPVLRGALAAGSYMLKDPDPAQAKDKVSTITGLSEKAIEKAKSLFGKYERYATEYPPTGPPTVNVKESGDITDIKPFTSKAERGINEGKLYYAKQLTPEAEEFAKDRLLINKSLAAGFEPYFDPAKRFDVSPLYHPTEYSMFSAADPAKAETIAKYDRLYGTPQARARLQQGYEHGLTLPGSPDWYLMGQLEQKYIDRYGPDLGRQLFAKEYAGPMAAATGGSEPTQNFLMSHYGAMAGRGNIRLPVEGYNLPSPLGGRYATGNLDQMQRYISSGQLPFGPLNPKRHDFMYAFLGHKFPVVDEQMSGALVKGLTQPEWYSPASRVMAQEAAMRGIDPRRFQEIAWAGLKGLKEGPGFVYEGPMIGHVNRAIERTHRLTGMPVEEVVQRGLLEKQIPIYGAAGLLGGGAANQFINADAYRSQY